GDILSDEASELSGSLGLGGSLNVGYHIAAAQAQHGSAPDIQGQGVANPTSLVLSAATLLAWPGRRDGLADLLRAAEPIQDAVEVALAHQASRTGDLGGPLGTEAFTDIVLERLHAAMTTTES